MPGLLRLLHTCVRAGACLLPQLLYLRLLAQVRAGHDLGLLLAHLWPEHGLQLLLGHLRPGGLPAVLWHGLLLAHLRPELWLTQLRPELWLPRLGPELWLTPLLRAIRLLWVRLLWLGPRGGLRQPLQSGRSHGAQGHQVGVPRLGMSTGLRLRLRNLGGRVSLPC